MAASGSSPGVNGSGAKARSGLVSSMRQLSRSPSKQRAASQEESCDLCGITVPPGHHHLLHMTERRILCTCATCWADRSGDPELRPVGSRVTFLDDFDLSEDIWARFDIPIGLAFFLDSTSVDGVVAMYPSPAGATESELPMEAWKELAEANPILKSLEPDGEALIVNRISDQHEYVIAPIDECYALVGAVKLSWEGISGGAAIEQEVPAFFERLRRRAGVRS